MPWHPRGLLLSPSPGEVVGHSISRADVSDRAGEIVAQGILVGR